MQTQKIKQNDIKAEYISGCNICNTLNHGTCMSFCIMDVSERHSVIKKNAHLFRQVDSSEPD
jgi:hypothetical protein